MAFWFVIEKKLYSKAHCKSLLIIIFLLKKITTPPRSANTKLVTYNIKCVWGWILCSRIVHPLMFYSGYNGYYFFFIRFCYKFKKKTCEINTIQPYCSYPHVWCAEDIEPSNCFFFETKSHCVVEWAFLLSFWSIVLESLCSCLDQDSSYLSYSTHMKKFSKIISWHNILVIQPV